MNQLLETYLQLYCTMQQHEWAKLLLLAQYVRNSWPNTTMKQTPFNTLIGYTPIAHQLVRTVQLPLLQDQQEKIKASRLVAIEALLASQSQEG